MNTYIHTCISRVIYIYKYIYYVYIYDRTKQEEATKLRVVNLSLPIYNKEGFNMIERRIKRGERGAGKKKREI